MNVRIAFGNSSLQGSHDHQPTGLMYGIIPHAGVLPNGGLAKTWSNLSMWVLMKCCSHALGEMCCSKTWNCIPELFVKMRFLCGPRSKRPYMSGNL